MITYHSNSPKMDVQSDTENPNYVEIVDNTIRTISTSFDTSDVDSVSLKNFYYQLYQLRDYLAQQAS